MNKTTIDHIKPPSDVTRLNCILLELDTVIMPVLSERVNIESYAKKLALFADIFYAKCGTEDIGICAVYLNDKNYGFISAIAVKQEYQNLGVGKKLWEETKENMLKKKIYRINLNVIKGNNKAIMFYQNNGFKEICHDALWIKMQYEIVE